MRKVLLFNRKWLSWRIRRNVTPTNFNNILKHFIGEIIFNMINSTWFKFFPYLENIKKYYSKFSWIIIGQLQLQFPACNVCFIQNSVAHLQNIKKYRIFFSFIKLIILRSFERYVTYGWIHLIMSADYWNKCAWEKTGISIE